MATRLQAPVPQLDHNASACVLSHMENAYYLLCHVNHAVSWQSRVEVQISVRLLVSQRLDGLSRQPESVRSNMLPKERVPANPTVRLLSGVGRVAGMCK